MNAKTLSSRDRRAFLLGGLVMIAGAVWVLGVRPYYSLLREVSDHLAAERALLQREMGVLAGVDDYPLVLERGAQLLSRVGPSLFTGETSGVASAAFAQYLQESARVRRVFITRVDPDPTESVGADINALPLRVQGETDLEGLLTLLDHLEKGPKLVNVEELTIRNVARGGRTATSDMEILSFTFTARGYQLMEFDVPAPATTRDEVLP